MADYPKIKISTISTTSIKFTIVAANNWSDNEPFYVFYRDASNANDSNWYTVEGKSSGATFTISGLSSGAQYYFRLSSVYGSLSSTNADLGTLTNKTTSSAAFSCGSITTVSTTTEYIVYIEYDANGGVGAPSSQTVTSTSSSQISVTLRSYYPSPPTGYVFDCWYCSKKGKYYDPGDTDTFTGSSGGVTYTMVAQWKKIVQYSLSMECGDGITQRRLSYTLNGESGKTSTSNPIYFDANTYVYLSSFTLDNNYSYPVIVQNLDSGGKFTMSSSSSTKWSFNGQSSPPSRGYLIYATPSYYEIKITYNANGGIGAPSSQTANNTNSNVSITLHSYGPSRDGYKFNGWYCAQTGKTYSLGQSTTFPGSPECITYELVAQWIAVYTVTFRHMLGDTTQETIESIQANATITLKNYAGSYSGYIYDHAEDSSGNIIPTLTITRNTTVYLIYIANTITITFNHYRGNALYTTTTTNVNYGTTITTSNYKITTMPNCVYNSASTSSFTATTNKTVNLYYLFAWTYAKTKGVEFNLTATEWNNLIAFVNAQRTSNYSFTTAVKGNSFTASIYNEMVSAIGVGTKVSKGDIITAVLMNQLVTNANNM